ncbi:lysylphosphatidylglycerol synthase transmembrane domain-containing protein [Achromobacter xylosoxidans]|uniref:lysylphosphatidylglycerol synthase transmembrane domain-containing protein n=1 Tax=Alcaligenes xylosoxydans xylosoxydans TaxID=85698 RepID=UPI00190316AD|nr:lysylphosphatidylglycerol synthase transmembrane domain-containing protein [Achromobacter xylosoxidans]MBK1982968.1 flippase-like domain-containing protein [Achromobacter xylosoxidans]MCZ8383027.1 lysylphosphatidylglycerol synthase transmembrane domain-containing protein [Achromobacter xylosoxidans]
MTMSLANRIHDRLRQVRLSTFIKFAVLACLGYLAYRHGNFDELMQGFDRRLLIAVLAVQPIVFVTLIVLGARHAALIPPPHVPLIRATKAMALSQGLNLLIPGRLSELIKGTYLRDNCGVPLSVGMAAVLLERTVDMLIVAVLGYVGLALYFSALDTRVVVVFSLAPVIVILVALRGKSLVLGILRRLPWKALGSFMERVYLQFADTVGTAAFARSLFYGVAAWGLSYLNIYMVLSLSVDMPMSLSRALFIFMFTTLAAAIPALPGSIGTYEAAAIVGLKTLGYSVSEALPIAIGMHVAQLVLPLLLALLIMLAERLGISSLIAELRSATRR